MLNYFKQAKTKALLATIATFFCVMIGIELVYWLISNYGRQIIGGVLFVSALYFLWNLYEYFVEKYTNKNDENNASN